MKNPRNFESLLRPIGKILRFSSYFMRPSTSFVQDSMASDLIQFHFEIKCWLQRKGKSVFFMLRVHPFLLVVVVSPCGGFKLACFRTNSQYTCLCLLAIFN